MKLSRTLFAVALFALPAASSLAETVWQMPTPYPQANFHTQNIEQFAKDVEAATDGELKIVVHPAGSLIKHAEIKNAVRAGQVEIGEFIISSLANEDPIFALELGSLRGDVLRRCRQALSGVESGSVRRARTSADDAAVLGAVAGAGALYGSADRDRSGSAGGSDAGL